MEDEGSFGSHRVSELSENPTSRVAQVQAAATTIADTGVCEVIVVEDLMNSSDVGTWMSPNHMNLSGLVTLAGDGYFTHTSIASTRRMPLQPRPPAPSCGLPPPGGERSVWGDDPSCKGVRRFKQFILFCLMV